MQEVEKKEMGLDTSHLSDCLLYSRERKKRQKQRKEGEVKGDTRAAFVVNPKHSRKTKTAKKHKQTGFIFVLSTVCRSITDGQLKK